MCNFLVSLFLYLDFSLLNCIHFITCADFQRFAYYKFTVSTVVYSQDAGHLSTVELTRSCKTQLLLYLITYHHIVKTTRDQTIGWNLFISTPTPDPPPPIKLLIKSGQDKKYVSTGKHVEEFEAETLVQHVGQRTDSKRSELPQIWGIYLH